MAWSCSAASNEALIANLLKEKLVKTEAVAAAMRRVDRAWFLPQSPASLAAAYEDAPQSIGYSVTISAPHMHAIMLEILAPYILGRQQPQQGAMRVLDVGSGSGYLTAVMAAMCEATVPEWQVVGIEHVNKLQERSTAVVAQRFPDWMRSGRVCIVEGDGRAPATALVSIGGSAAALEGEEAKFDLIHVGAATPSIPTPLVDLLKRGGCMVIPVGDEHETQQLLICRKGADGKVATSNDCLVRFVPLTSLADQQTR